MTTPEANPPPDENQGRNEWGPPWWARRNWHASSSGLNPPWHSKRRFLFWRIARVLLMALALFLLGMGALAFLLTRLFGGGQ